MKLGRGSHIRTYATATNDFYRPYCAALLEMSVAETTLSAVELPIEATNLPGTSTTSSP